MYLIDTNILIYHLADAPRATQFLQAHRGKMYISTITVIEVLSFAADDKALAMAEAFLKDNFIWLDVSRDIVFASAKIRRAKKTKTPDAIIGATALCHQLTIVTRNCKDFEHLRLQIINPMDES